MELLIISFTLFFSIFLQTEAVEPNTKGPPVKCNHNGPEIAYPFSIQALNTLNCTHQQGFLLSCRENKTFIHFPSYGDLVVKTISYQTKRLSLVDPKNCVHEVFLNLDLSHSQYKYYYVLKEYTYFNCSVELKGSFVQVPCLSGFGRHVYVTESHKQVPAATCQKMKTVTIPFSYSPYLSDDSFGLSFTWDLPGTDDSVVKRGCHVFGIVSSLSLAHMNASSIIIVILLVAALLGTKAYFSTGRLAENLLQQYETLKRAKYSALEGNEASDDKVDTKVGNETIEVSVN